MPNPAMGKLSEHVKAARFLQTALAAISTTNPEYGFQHNVRHVFRVMRDPRSEYHAHMPYICLVGGRRRYTTGDDGAPMNFYETFAEFRAWGFTLVGKDTDPDYNPEDVLDQFIADIQAALLLPFELIGGHEDSVVDHLHLRDADHMVIAGQEPIGVCEVGFEAQYMIRSSVEPDAIPPVDGPYQGRT